MTILIDRDEAVARLQKQAEEDARRGRLQSASILKRAIDILMSLPDAESARTPVAYIVRGADVDRLSWNRPLLSDCIPLYQALPRRK